eukprot:ANDGO_08055.mRNA.1 hypothetical protein
MQVEEAADGLECELSSCEQFLNFGDRPDARSLEETVSVYALALGSRKSLESFWLLGALQLVHSFLLVPQRASMCFQELFLPFVKSSLCVDPVSLDKLSRAEIGKLAVQRAMVGSFDIPLLYVEDQNPEFACAISMFPVLQASQQHQNPHHAQDYLAVFRSWQASLRRIPLSDDEYTLQIWQILSGEDHAMIEHAPGALELFAARLLFRFPVLKREDAIMQLQNAFRDYHSSKDKQEDEMGIWFAELIALIMENRPVDILLKVRDSFEPPQIWFAAHLAHLFFVKKLVDEDVMKQYMEDYIMEIFPSLPLVALEYSLRISRDLTTKLLDELHVDSEGEWNEWAKWVSKNRIMTFESWLTKSPWRAEYVKTGQWSKVVGTYAFDERELEETLTLAEALKVHPTAQQGWLASLQKLFSPTLRHSLSSAELTVMLQHASRLSHQFRLALIEHLQTLSPSEFALDPVQLSICLGLIDSVRNSLPKTDLSRLRELRIQFSRRAAVSILHADATFF